MFRSQPPHPTRPPENSQARRAMSSMRAWSKLRELAALALCCLAVALAPGYKLRELAALALCCLAVALGPVTHRRRPPTTPAKQRRAISSVPPKTSCRKSNSFVKPSVSATTTPRWRGLWTATPYTSTPRLWRCSTKSAAFRFRCRFHRPRRAAFRSSPSLPPT